MKIAAAQGFWRTLTIEEAAIEHTTVVFGRVCVIYNIVGNIAGLNMPKPRLHSYNKWSRISPHFNDDICPHAQTNPPQK